MVEEWEINVAQEALARVPGLREEIGYAEADLRAQLRENYVGGGANAVVFMTADETSVFKVTFDFYQATLAIHARRERPHGIVPVFGVYDLDSIRRKGTLLPAWVIVERAVLPLPLLQRRGAGRADAEQREAVRVYKAAKWALDEVLDDIGGGFRRPHKPGKRRPERLKEAFLWDLRSALLWISTHRIDDDQQELTGWDIENQDNVGFDPDDGTLVVLDLGQGAVSGDTIAAED